MESNRFILEPSREIPVIEADVLVAGAGTAGCIAAIAAARLGAKVVMIEKMPVPGGTYTNGGNHCSSFYAASDDPETAKRIVGGIPYELALRIMDAGGSEGFLPTPNTKHRSPFSFLSKHYVYKGVLSEMLLEEGITVYLQTLMCGAELEGDSIRCVFIENKNGRSAVKAKQFIDCTGDGDLAKAAGVEQVPTWKDYTEVCTSPTGLVFGMGGIDYDRAVAENPNSVRANREDKSFMLIHPLDPERYKPLMEMDLTPFTSFQFMNPGEATYINNTKGECIDGSDAEAYSMAELRTRDKIMKLAKAFKDCVPGFEESYMSWASTQLGVRNSWTTVCDKMITQEDISKAASFEDDIGLYGFHDLARRPECLVPDPGFYGFPYRMLLAKDCQNLFMAGRCVTVENVAHMSTRNVVGCQLMGQGAGVAAALCAQMDCTSRKLPYDKLRQALLDQDVILDV